jgi:N-acetylglucosamine-6-sulfatase
VSLRVPTLMRGPGLAAGTVTDRPLLTIDLAPTVLGLAGARPAPEMDGVDVLPLTAQDGWSRGVLTETGPRAQSLNRRRDDLLDLPAGPSPLRFTQGVRTARYLYVEHASRERELYDVLTDPLEQTNLVDDPAQQPIVRRLAALLDELRTCSGASCATPLPEDLRAP